jgi:hypothetical protein
MFPDVAIVREVQQELDTVIEEGVVNIVNLLKNQVRGRQHCQPPQKPGQGSSTLSTSSKTRSGVVNISTSSKTRSVLQGSSTLSTSSKTRSVLPGSSTLSTSSKTRSVLQGSSTLSTSSKTRSVFQGVVNIVNLRKNQVNSLGVFTKGPAVLSEQ